MLTHNRVHTPLAHTQLAHTQLVHTRLLIAPLVTPLLVRTQLVFTPLVHTQLVIMTKRKSGRVICGLSVVVSGGCVVFRVDLLLSTYHCVTEEVQSLVSKITIFSEA